MGQAARIAEALGERARPPAAATVEAVEARLHAGRPLLVGVFADQDADTINAIAREVGLDLVQLSGSEPWEVCELIERPVLKCLKVRQDQKAAEVLAQVHGGALLLLDPYVEGAYGGAGVTLDWAVAAQVAKGHPVMLAGGLRPDNVARAVTIVHPWAVDVSSGVESDGAKDVAKIRAFIKAAKEAS
jgi:phosphoribosylanthranilate isomerase